MDVSPIQRLAATSNYAIRPAAAPAVTSTTSSAQGGARSADQQATRPRVATPSTRVLVSWHPGGMGYVTQVVDQHSGTVVHQTPPEQVLAMVMQVIQRLEAGTR